MTETQSNPSAVRIEAHYWFLPEEQKSLNLFPAVVAKVREARPAEESIEYTTEVTEEGTFVKVGRTVTDIATKMQLAHQKEVTQAVLNTVLMQYNAEHIIQKNGAGFYPPDTLYDGE